MQSLRRTGSGSDALCPPRRKTASAALCRLWRHGGTDLRTHHSDEAERTPVFAMGNKIPLVCAVSLTDEQVLAGLLDDERVPFRFGITPDERRMLFGRLAEERIARRQLEATIEILQREAQSAREEADIIDRKARQWAAEQVRREIRMASAMPQWVSITYALADRIEAGPAK